jgi:hypothetical protein
MYPNLQEPFPPPYQEEKETKTEQITTYGYKLSSWEVGQMIIGLKKDHPEALCSCTPTCWCFKNNGVIQKRLPIDCVIIQSNEGYYHLVFNYINQYDKEDDDFLDDLEEKLKLKKREKFMKKVLEYARMLGTSTSIPYERNLYIKKSDTIEEIVNW